MMQFRYRGFNSPPGGKYFYTAPETGRRFEAKDCMATLLEQIRGHYKVNGIPIPDNLLLLVEDYICMHVLPGYCIGPDPRDPTEIPPTFFDVVANMEKYFRGKTLKLVTVREADQRATLCVRCKENSLGFCASCTGLRSQASGYVGGRKLPQDTFLGVCKKVRLPCNALVHVSEPPGCPGLPDNCWIVKP